MSKLSEATKAFSFDDVLLVPRYSEISSRSQVKLNVSLGKGINLKIPVISANMKHVTESSMAKAILELGGLPIIHRFCSTQEQINMIKENPGTAASVGLQPEEQVKAQSLIDAGCKVLCLDVAHAHHLGALKMVAYLANKYPHCLLIAGNVSTAAGAKALNDYGADVIKVGQGSGSICSTRIETGNGVPQLSALEEIASAKLKAKIIADGGIRKAGDIVKALVFADAVMLGSLLAGTDESPGEVVVVDGKSYKNYVGSSTFKSSRIEGVAALTSYKGSVKNVISTLMDGLQSGLSYQGVDNLNDLKKVARFILISHAALQESHPHSHPIIRN